MTQGTERKAQTQDSLEGANQIQPTTRRAPSISGSANSAGPVLLNSFTERTIGKLQDFSTKEVREQVALKRERSDMEGRVAFEQGKSFQEVEMDGDKYALQGYRVLQAQTASSSLFAQQKAAIAAGGFESSPEEFRASYADALAEGIEGLDPITASMVKENMTRQMPQLVGSHMQLHLQDQEKRAYSSLATSVHVMSQDDTVDAELVLNATGGPDAPSAGLSTSRRTAAVVDGIVLGFSEGNAKAYSKLVKAGVLDNLEPGQIQKLRQAEASFQQREAKKINTAWIAEDSDIRNRISTGDLAPLDAVNEYSLAASKHGIEIDAHTGKAIFLLAEEAQEYAAKGDVVLIQEAAKRGDYETIAKISEGFMVQAESGGDPNALSPKGAMGTHQVMPATMSDPGYGIKPADIKDPKDVARVGKEYWAKMVAGNKGHSSLTWEAGDVEAAAVAYNAGPVNAKKWIAAGRDYAVLPKRSETEPYAKGILAKTQGAGPVTAQERLEVAREYKKQTEERINLAAHEKYKVIQLEIDEAFNDAKLSDREYVEQSNAARSTLKVERTKAITNHITSTMDKLHTKTRANVKAESKELLDARYKEITNSYTRKMGVEGQSPEYYERVAQEHVQTISTLYGEHGFTVADMGYSNIIDHTTKTLATSLDKFDDWNIDQNRIERAAKTKTISSLSPELQERAFKQITDTIGQQVADAVETGEIPKDAASDATRKLLQDNYLAVGLVDPQVKIESSAAMQGDLINDKGETNKGIMTLVENYSDLKRSNPRVAATMFDEAGRYKAEAIIAAAGGINAPIQQGMELYERGKMGVGNVDFSDPELLKDTTKRIERAVNGRFGFGGLINKKDVGSFQAFFDGALTQDDKHNRSERDRDILNSEETSDELQGYIKAEVFRMAKHLPGADPKYLVDEAVANVSRLTDFVGGSVIKMDDGFGLKHQLFGDKLSDYDKPDLVNSVIVDHLRDLSKDPAFSHISEASGLQALNPFGKDVDTLGDVKEIDRVGVRPFIVITSGQELYVQITKQDGTASDPIWLDLPTIGNDYINKYEAQLANK